MRLARAVLRSEGTLRSLIDVLIGSRGVISTGPRSPPFVAFAGRAVRARAHPPPEIAIASIAARAWRFIAAHPFGERGLADSAVRMRGRAPSRSIGRVTCHKYPS